METSVITKLEQLKHRVEELSLLLSDADIIQDQLRFRSLSREYADIEGIVTCFNDYQNLNDEINTAQELLADNTDKELALFFSEELQSMQKQRANLEARLRYLLIPKDPDDHKNLFLEIRAGTGGEEAALFAACLARMYIRYAEFKHWTTEVINRSNSERGGYKTFILRVAGQAAYSQLKFESGVHRVQRIPETESQGRIHTSACTVAALPEADEIEVFEVNSVDLRIDTFRASGAGGQHVNKTDSAIRITHLPTGMVVECQDERSQHKNKARAMALLQAKLLTTERDKQRLHEAENRRNLVGSGDRSERIRTYNFPQNRVCDHRINLTLYRLDEFIVGNLDMIIEPLINEHRIDQLALLATQ